MSFYKLKQPSLAISLLPAPTKTLSSAAACENQEITKNTKKHKKNKQNQQNTKKHVKIIETSEFLADLFSFRVSFATCSCNSQSSASFPVLATPQQDKEHSMRSHVFLSEMQIVVKKRCVFVFVWKRVFLAYESYENMFWICLDMFSCVFHVDLCVCVSVRLWCFLFAFSQVPLA